MVQSCSPLWNFLLIMAGSLASVSVHIMLKKTLLVPLSNWNLIFWRGLFQMLLSGVFILKNRKRGISTFPVSKYHLISVSKSYKWRSYILRRPQNFEKFPPYFCLQYIQTKVRGRFRKIFWPSQNVSTLTGFPQFWIPNSTFFLTCPCRFLHPNHLFQLAF